MKTIMLEEYSMSPREVREAIRKEFGLESILEDEQIGIHGCINPPIKAVHQRLEGIPGKNYFWTYKEYFNSSHVAVHVLGTHHSFLNDDSEADIAVSFNTRMADLGLRNLPRSSWSIRYHPLTHLFGYGEHDNDAGTPIWYGLAGERIGKETLYNDHRLYVRQSPNLLDILGVRDMTPFFVSVIDDLTFVSLTAAGYVREQLPRLRR